MPFKDPEKKRAYMADYKKKWDDANKTQTLQYAKSYYANNLDAITTRRGTKSVREMHAEQQRKWRQDNPALARAIESTVRAKRRAAVRSSDEHFSNQQWLDLLQHYSHCCLACGSSDDLVPDHIKPLSRGGSNDIGNIQPLCATCNKRKATKSTDYRPV